jgi:hypothetical protein
VIDDVSVAAVAYVKYPDIVPFACFELGNVKAVLVVSVEVGF